METSTKDSKHVEQVEAAQLLTEIYPILARFVYAEPNEGEKLEWFSEKEMEKIAKK